MRQKTFFLSADAIKPNLAPHRGSCLAADTITISGNRVGFMFREKPDNEHDSGWRFFSGTESDEYCSNAENFGMYDINTIANYDPDIIPLLDSPTGSAFGRQSGSAAFVAEEFPAAQDDD